MHNPSPDSILLLPGHFQGMGKKDGRIAMETLPETFKIDRQSNQNIQFAEYLILESALWLLFEDKYKKNKCDSSHEILNSILIYGLIFILTMKEYIRIILYPLLMVIILIQSSSCSKDDDIIPELITYGTVTDIDGNAYKTIQIEIPTGGSKGLKASQSITQTWMAENLKTTKYSNGDPIPEITQNQNWVALTTGALCSYNNDSKNSETYGYLYNWYAVNTGSLCPTGWHVPSDVEWATLITYLGGTNVAGGKLKETGNKHWGKPNSGATNEIGFTALPGGSRVWDGSFNLIGQDGFWWSSSEQDNSTSWSNFMSSSNSIIETGNFSKHTGMSVRCLMGETPKLPVLTTTAATNISQVSATSGGNIVSDISTSDVIIRGICWSNFPDPVRDPKYNYNNTADGAGSGSFTSNLINLLPGTKYYVRAYATNLGGTAYGNQISFTTVPPGLGIIFNPDLTYGSVSDIEGNVYKTIQIGNQLWMAENFKTTRLNDNTGIVNVTTSWTGITSPGYCWYNNDASTYKASYGALYNWPSVNSGKLCPTGWHVPSKEDWTILIDFLGGTATAGDKLREIGTAHWNSANSGVTNSSGFTALPGGFHSNTSSTNIGYNGYWWSSTPGDFPSSVYSMNIFYTRSDSKIGNNTLESGLSVRCLKDN